MGEFADLRVGGSTAIDLGDDGLGGRVANVEKPGLDGDFSGFGEISKGDHVGVHWGIGPSEIAKLRGNAGRLLRIKAGADEFDDATKLQIVSNDLSEESGVRLGGVGAGSEVGDGDAGFIGVAETGARAKPVALGVGGSGKKEKKYSGEELESF
ncbi:MAG: hypothetical protein NVS9B13_25810 [Candidatus Acidiferrum sp.]